MLPIKYLNGWLFGIDANRVKPEAKDLVIEYQRECFDVLSAHFMPQPQYGLKELPPSPYISESESAQFKKSIEAHCKQSSDKYGVLYRKVYEYYGITSYMHIPAGKLEEAAKLCGMKLLKLVKSKIPEEIPNDDLLHVTPLELAGLVDQKVKEAISGEFIAKDCPKYHHPITDWQPTTRYGHTAYLTYQEIMRVEPMNRPLWQMLHKLAKDGHDVAGAEAEYNALKLLTNIFYKKLDSLKNIFETLDSFGENIYLP